MTGEQLLAAMTALSGELSTLTSEPQMVEAALDVFVTLLPDRALCIRILDLRGREPARAYVRGANLRAGVVDEGIALPEAALTRAKLKSAVAASARLTVRERWDSPFTGVASGFVVPLVTAGELYGDRIPQVDMRIAKLLRFGRTRTNVGIDIYNLFNSNVPLTYVNVYGPTWGNPQSVLDARFAKISAQIDF